jgi:predicted nucleic acid-binding protein
MGLILDTTILIASDRRGGSVRTMLTPIRSRFGEIDIALSAVSVVEFTHGIFGARTPADQNRRRIFAEEAFHELVVHPLTLEIGQLAGRIEGEQAAKASALPSRIL